MSEGLETGPDTSNCAENVIFIAHSVFSPSDKLETLFVIPLLNVGSLKVLKSQKSPPPVSTSIANKGTRSSLATLD